MAKMSNVYGTVLDEPMVNDELGQFETIFIPVSHTDSDANWSIEDDDLLTAQTQVEHNKLLNTFYNERMTNPMWKEMGIIEEKNSPHYNSKDDKPRKDVNARSSVINNIAYDKDNNLAFLQMGNKWYTYKASPDQFKRFMSAGSLGKEMNNIKHGKSSSMEKTAVRKAPQHNSGSIFSTVLNGLLK